jgi:hypothetical protein
MDLLMYAHSVQVLSGSFPLVWPISWATETGCNQRELAANRMMPRGTQTYGVEEKINLVRWQEPDALPYFSGHLGRGAGRTATALDANWLAQFGSHQCRRPGPFSFSRVHALFSSCLIGTVALH